MKHPDEGLARFMERNAIIRVIFPLSGGLFTCTACPTVATSFPSGPSDYGRSRTKR